MGKLETIVAVVLHIIFVMFYLLIFNVSPLHPYSCPPVAGTQTWVSPEWSAIQVQKQFGETKARPRALYLCMADQPPKRVECFAAT